MARPDVSADGASAAPKPRKADDAYDQLKRLIVSLKLAPGELLDERTLMARLDVGRTPLREAIQRLAAEHLVTSLPRRGYYVRDLSIAELSEMINAREILEPKVARLAVRYITDEEIQQLRLTISDTISHIRRNDYESTMYHDLEFHRAIARASGNRYLETAINRINTELLRYWYISFSFGGDLNPTFAHHTRLLDVMESRDEDAVESAMHEHIQRFRERIKHVMLGGTNILERSEIV